MRSRLKHSVSSFSEPAKARTQSLKEMVDAKAFAQAVEINAGYEKTQQAVLQRLQETVLQAGETVRAELQDIYRLDISKAGAQGAGFEDLKKLLDKAVAANTEALKAQAHFQYDITQRTGECLAALADARTKTLKD